MAEIKKQNEINQYSRSYQLIKTTLLIMKLRFQGNWKRQWMIDKKKAKIQELKEFIVFQNQFNDLTENTFPFFQNFPTTPINLLCLN